ncbi:zinc finger protein 341-like [Leptopilina boulardi]|uniref:zinc finger protein 341-like n=1 Tax=Leptopilina boulardi TaxID=63433 RepID=UPI0021F57599|nr:zinc finger protein 341-like [Leptopilina boulardi]
MANSIFDALTGVCLDNSTVQSLLESQTLITQVEQSVIDQDEEDIFQCGKCKCQFTSLQLFILHKQEHFKVQEQSVDISQYLVTNTSQIVSTEEPCSDGTQYQESFDQTDQLDEPIILEGNDMLFSMDQEGSSYLPSDSGFNVPIILNTESIDSFGNPSVNSDTESISVKVHNIQSLEDKNCQNEDFTTSNIYHNFTDEIHIINPNDKEKKHSSEQENQPTQNLKYKCDFCEKQFSKKFYWQQHERSHTGEKPYQCVVCGRSFAQKSNVKKHMSSHKVWPGTAIHSLPPEAPTDGSIDKTYHCQFCKEIFDSYKALKAHLIVSHLTLKVYKCVQLGCSLMFQELDDFLEHTRSHKRSEYRCHVCGKVFNTLSDLGSHQYSHTVRKQKTTEKYYCCSICKSSFSNLESLNHHMETTTHDYACPHCGKSFYVERFLRRHLKTHAAQSRFICEDCGKAFKTEQYLTNHKLIHNDETPYICSYCPSKFKRKDRLRRHMLIHDLTKRLKCPYRNYVGCMREFSRPDKLKRHVLTHSDIKTFRCNLCDKNFHRPQAHKHHELYKHCLKCEVCSLEFRTPEQLLNHSCEPIIEENSKIATKGIKNTKTRKTISKRKSNSKIAHNKTKNQKLDELEEIEDCDDNIMNNFVEINGDGEILIDESSCNSFEKEMELTPEDSDSEFIAYLKMSVREELDTNNSHDESK